MSLFYITIIVIFPVFAGMYLQRYFFGRRIYPKKISDLLKALFHLIVVITGIIILVGYVVSNPH